MRMPRIPPPILVLAIGGAMMATRWIDTPLALPDALRWPLTGLFLLVALALGPPAVFSFRKFETTIDPVRVNLATRLVTTGPYRLSRNPMYVSLAALLLALASALGVGLSYLGPLLFIAIVHLGQIPAEEAAMQKAFGDDYASYARSVRRWL